MTPASRAKPRMRTDAEMAQYVREHQCWNADCDVTIADWDRGIRALAAAASRPAALDVLTVPRDLLESLVDDGECRFDHHGGCQEHGYLSLAPGEQCPQAELKARLASEAKP